VGAARSYQFLFEARDRVDFPLTLLWRVGDPLAAALARLHAVTEDETAGRGQAAATAGLAFTAMGPLRDCLCGGRP
jgi:hypothetical protein